MGLLMQDSTFALSLDPSSLARISALVHAMPTFERYYTSAMRACVNLVNKKAQENAPVLRGTLRRGIRGYVRSPWLGQVGVLASVPYARRREFGFDGRTDSLGRYYPLDPKDPAKRTKMHYLQRALEDSRPFIRTTYRTATQLAIKEILI